MEIRINRDGAEFGPYSLEQVNQLMTEGSLLPTDLAWYDPMETWAELSQVAANLNQAATPAPQLTETAAGEYRGGGRYRILKQLGRGGMGVVYLALDEQLNEEVALKSFPPEMAVDESALDDMKREVQKSRKLSHPNIIRMHDFVNPPGEDPFVTMEFVEGQELAEMRRDQANGVFAWEDIKQYIIQLCDALTTAHNENTVHRDLKPTQMMINNEGRLKLCDFGIAASMADSISFSSMKHAVSGTLLFMSPQQMNGEVPRATDDIYALGATLYDLMTGKPPFYTGNVNAQVMNRPPISMMERLAEFGIENDIPDYVDQLVLACLSKESAHRPASAEEIKNWILSEGGAATLKTIRLAFQPPGFSKELVFDLNRKKFQGVCSVLSVLVLGVLGWMVFKPPPVYDLPQLRQKLQNGQIVYLSLDSAPNTQLAAIRGQLQFEERQSDRGLNLTSTNYVDILNYRGKNLESIQGANFTLSAHFMPYSVPGEKTKHEQQYAILMKPGHHLGLSYGYDRRFVMSHQYVASGKTNLVAAISSGKFDENEWHHVVGTVNRSEGTVKLFVDGQESGSAKFPANSRGYVSSKPWRIGVASPLGKTHQWHADGAVDQVRIYNRSLEGDEVKELYVVEQPAPFEKEMLVYYPFNAGDIKNVKESLPSKGSAGGFSLAEPTNNPLLKPEPTEDRFGEPNAAYLFDGMTNSLASGRGGSRSYLLASPNESRALSVWFKPEEITNSRQSVAAIGSADANAGWEILVDSEEGLVGNWGGGTNYLSGGSIRAGQWHHAVFSYDDTMKLISLYLDGDLLGTFTNQLATTSATLRLGGPPLTPKSKKPKNRNKKNEGEPGVKKVEYSYFHGSIDDVRFYLRDLPPEDVSALYDGEKPVSWFWLYALGTVVLLAGVGAFLFWKGVRIPAKLMDPLLQRLPDKLSAPLVNLRAAA
ncbi:MAG: protein kinase [Verrucomicrobia subdivision 3 bacterium]|nr:protein kinase [Limisphaerales bacterium]